MNEHLWIVVAVVVVAVCSVAFVASIPALAICAVRGNMRSCTRISVGMSMLAGVALVAAVAIGSSPSAYSILP